MRSCGCVLFGAVLGVVLVAVTGLALIEFTDPPIGDLRA